MKKRGKNIKKIVLNVLFYILLTIIFVPISFTLLFRVPMVQTLSTRMLMQWISTKTDYHITVGKLDVNIFGNINIHTVKLLNPNNDTILTAGNINVNPSYLSFFGKKFRLHEVNIDSADFRLVMQKGNNDFDFINFINSFGNPDTISISSSKHFLMNIKQLKIFNSSFIYCNKNDFHNTGHTLDYSNLNIDNVNIIAHDFHLTDDSIHMNINHLQGREQHGLMIKHMSGIVTISNKELSLIKAKIITGKSNLNLDFSMKTNSWNSYDNFYNLVMLRTNIRKSVINLSDLGYFVPAFAPMKNTITVSSTAKGFLSSLSIKNLLINFGKNSHVLTDIIVKGLPDVNKSHFNAVIKMLETNRTDLATLKLPTGKIIDIEYLPENETVNINGVFNGTYSNFKSNLLLKLQKGLIDINAEMKPITGGFALHADINSKKTDIGRYLKTGNIPGNTSFNIAINTSFNNDFNNLQLAASGNIKFMEFSNFTLNNIQLESSYKNDSITTNFAIDDKDLLANISGAILLADDPVFNYKIDVLKSNLKKFHILPDKNLKLHSKIILKLKGINPDSMNLVLKMTNNKLAFGDDWYHLDSIILKKYNVKNEQNLLLNSDFEHFKLTGNFKWEKLPEMFNNMYNYYFSTTYKHQRQKNKTPQHVVFKLKLINPDIIGEQFVKGLEIAHGSTINANMDFANNLFAAMGKSNRINFANIDFRDVNISYSPLNGGVSGLISANNIILKDSTKEDKTVLGLDKFVLKTVALHDSLHYAISWLNNDTLKKNSGNITGNYIVNDNNSIFKINRSIVYVNDTLWNINPENELISNSSGVLIRNFDIHRGGSSISIMGKLPKKQADTIHIRFNRWDLSNFNFLYKMWKFNLNGIINGEMNMSIGNNKFWFISDLKISNLYFNHILMGDAHILNTWDNDRQSIFIKSQIVRKGNSGIGEVFALDGFLFPFDKKQNFNIKANFNRFKIKALEPFLKDYVTELEGKASGDIKLLGTFQQPILKGYVDFNRTALKINYLNTKYSFSNKIVFDANKIDFGSMILYDTLGNHATVSGGLLHNYFSNPKFNLTIHADKFLFFDTNRQQNDIYYGTAIASGNIYIKGPPNNISLSIDAKSKKGTKVTIPLDYTTEILDKDYIIFVPNQSDSTLSDTVQKKQIVNNSSKYNILLKMAIQPNANIKIELPYDMGNIKSEGRGNLTMHTNSEGDLSIVGDYMVEKGEFNFNLQNLISKRFLLTKGGKISWSGDPYTANLNIKGLYTVKTNYSSLGMIVDSSANYKNRLNVNCYIILSGSLAEPVMRFEIKFPELDPDMQRLVYARLDTTNQALVNQQMISLLVLGSFSFSNASNVSLSSSYYSIIANQLSGLLSQVSKDVDIGINYKPGDNISQEEFEVALSTQLFDNRLIINGNFGMTYDRSNRTASNIVGDVDINFKLTRDGRWILKAYNHSNVNSWYYYNNYDKVSPYTQGVGIAYQKDFNNIGEIFANRKKKKIKNKKSHEEKN